MLAGFMPRLRYLSASKSLFVQFQCPISFGGRVLLSAWDDYAWERFDRREPRRCACPFRMTQLNNRALKRGRDLRVVRAAKTAPFRPSQQIPMVPRTDIRGTPALP
jgi:hypothetical protein